MDIDRAYVLLLGDLKGSTDLEAGPSDAAFESLNVAIDKLTERFRGELVLGLEVNYGDEFAGLFRSAIPVYDVIDALRSMLHDQVSFRVAVARGRVGHVSDSLTRLGGPVFRQANDSLEHLKRRGLFADWQVGTSLTNRTLTALTETSQTLRSEMTTYQYQVFRKLAEGHSQIDIAKCMNKHPQSVSNAAKKGHATLAIQVDELIRDHLQIAEQSVSIETGKSIVSD